jgi:hypothetical protein
MEQLADVLIASGIDRRAAVKGAAAVHAHQKKLDAFLPSAPQLSATPTARIELGDALWRALSRVWDARDKRLHLGALFFALGRPPLGTWSLRELAKQQGVSPEAASNETHNYQDILGLPRTAQQKSADAVASYQLSNGAQKKNTI